MVIIIDISGGVSVSLYKKNGGLKTLRVASNERPE